MKMDKLNCPFIPGGKANQGGNCIKSSCMFWNEIDQLCYIREIGSASNHYLRETKVAMERNMRGDIKEQVSNLTNEDREEHADIYYSKGEQLFLNGKSEEALMEFRKVILYCPDYFPALIRIAEILSYNGKYDESINVLKTVVKLQPFNGEIIKKLLIQYKLLYMNYEKKMDMYQKLIFRTEEEVNVLRNKLSDTETDPLLKKHLSFALYRLGYAYHVFHRSSRELHLKDLKKARKFFVESVKYDDKNLWSYWGIKDTLLIEYSYGNSKIEEMVEVCKRALAITPDSAQGKFELAEAYDICGGENGYELAIQFYKEAIEYSFVKDICYFRIGYIYEREYKYNQAMDMYKKSIEIKSANQKARYRLGNLYFINGMFEIAISEIMKVIEEFRKRPTNVYSYGYSFESVFFKEKVDLPHAVYLLGQIYSNIGNWDRSVDNLEHALELKPDFYEAFTELVKQYKNKYMLLENNEQYFDKIIDRFNQEYSLEPHNYLYGFKLAVSLIFLSPGDADRLNEYRKKAITLLKKVIQTLPDLFESYKALKEAYFIQKPTKEEVDELLNYFKKFLEFNPKSAIVYFHIGEIYYYQGNLKKAIINMEKALKLQPDLVEAYFVLIDIHTIQEDFSEALELASRLKKMRPYHRVIYFKLGMVYYFQSKYDLAEEEFKRAIEISKDYNDAIIQLARVYEKKADIDRAISRYEYVIRIDNNNPVIFFELGKILYIYKEDYSKAEENLKAAIQLNYQNAELYFMMGTLKKEQNSLDEAIEYINKAINISPENDIYYQSLSEIYLAKDDSANAIEKINKAIELNPEECGYRFSLGKIYSELGNFEKAISSFEKSVELRPDFVEGYLKLAFEKEKGGLFAESAKLYTKILQLDKNSVIALHRFGLLKVKEDDLEGAIELFDRCVACGGDNDQTIVRDFASLLNEYGDNEKAIHYYEIASKNVVDDIEFFREFGQVLFDSKKYDEAVSKLKLVIEMDDDDENTIFKVGDCYYRLENYSEASGYYKTVIDLDDERIDAFLRLGDIYEKEENWEEAVSTFSRVIDLGIVDSLIMYRLGVCYEHMDNLKEAENIYLSILKTEPDNHSVRFSLADIYKKSGDIDKAIEYYYKTIETDPENWRAFYELGKGYINKGRLDKAIQYLKKATDINTDSQEMRLELGKAYNSQGMPEEAIEQYRIGVDLDSENVSARFELGQLYYSVDRYDEAMSEYEIVIQRDPGNIRAHHELGKIYYDRFLYEKAIKEYEIALSYDSSNPILSFELGEVYFNMGDVENAISRFENAIELESDFVDAYNRLGSVYREREHFARAIEMFEQSIEFDPNDPKIFFELGDCYDNMGDDDKAIACYEKALVINPNYVNVIYKLGKKYKERAVWDKMSELYRTAIKLVPRNALFYFELGEAYRNSGKLDEAIVQLNKALTINPEFIDAIYSLASIYSIMQEYDKVIKIYRQILGMFPNNIRAHFELGKAYHKKYLVNEAISEFKKVITLDSNHKEVYEELGNIYLETGMFDEAINSYVKLVVVSPDRGDIWFKLGELYEKIGNGESSKEAYSKASELQPDNPEAYFKIAEDYFNKSDFQNAYKEFKNVFQIDPEFRSVAAKLGTVAVKIGKYSEGVQHLTKALEAENNYDLKFLLAGAYKALQEKEEAYKLYLEILEVKPDEIEILEEIVDFLYSSGRFSESREHMETLLKLNPSAMSYFRFGEVELSLNNVENAITSFIRAHELEPENMDIISKLCINYKKMKLFDDALIFAVETYERVEAAKEDEEILKTISEIYISKELYDKALEFYLKLEKIFPKNGEFLFQIGRCYRELGEDEKSMKYFRKAEAIDPDNPMLQYSLGEDFVKRGMLAKAIEKFKKVESMNPDFSGVYLKLGEIYEKQGLLDLALERYEKYITLEPGDEEAVNYLARIYYETNQQDKAIEIFEKQYESGVIQEDLIRKLYDYYSKINDDEKSSMYLSVLVDNYPDKQEYIFINAQKFYEQGDYESSEQYLIKLRESGYSHPKMATMLSEIYISTDRMKEALPFLQDYIDSHQEDWPGLFKIAVMYENNKKFTEAYKLYSQVLSLNPDDNEVIAKARSFVARRAYQELDYRKAIDICEKLIESEIANEDVYTIMYESYFQLGDLEKGMAALEMVKELAPESLKIREKLADFYYEKGFYRKCVEEYEFLIKEKPKRELFHEKLAWSYYHLKKYEDSATHFKVVLDLNPDNIDSYVGLGKVYVCSELYDEAIKLYRIASKLQPGNLSPLIEIAKVFSLQSQFDKAIMEFREILKKDPENDRVHIELGNIYQENGMIDQAIMEYKKAVEVDSENIPAKLELGKIYFKIGKSYKDQNMIGNAIKEFKFILSLDAFNSEANFNMGEYYKLKGLTEEALNHYKKALEKDPENETVLEAFNSVYEERVKVEIHDKIVQANAYLERNMLENASMEFNGALELISDCAPAYVGLAKIAMLKEDTENAKENYIRVLEIEPDNIIANEQLGTIYFEEKNYDEAIKHFKHLSDLDPDNDTYLLQLANSYRDNQYFDETIETYNKVISLNPSNIDAYIALGMIYENLENIQDAKQTFDKVLRLDSENTRALEFFARIQGEEIQTQIEVAFNAAKKYEAQNKYELAVGEYENVVDIMPGNVEGHYSIARLTSIIPHMKDRSINAFLRVIELDKSSKYKDAYLRAGLLYYEQEGYAPESIPLLEKAISFFPENLRAHLVLMEQYKFKFLNADEDEDTDQNYDFVVNSYQEEIDKDPENSSKYYLLGHFLTIMPSRAFSLPNPKEEAVSLLLNAKEKSPDNSDIRKELAVCYAQNGKVDEVIHEYQELAEIAPDDVEVYHKLGDVYFVSHEYEKSIETYKKVAELEGIDGLARRKIIDSYYKMYEKDESRHAKYFAILKGFKENALEVNTTDPMSHFELGYAYVKLSSSFILTAEEKNNSILQFKQAISIDPENLWSYWGLKMVYNKECIDGEHMHNDAISICKEALKKAPTSPRAHFELAEAYNDNYEKDMRRDAINEYRRAIDQDPNFIEAHYRLASIYRVKSMYDEAIKEYNIVIELDPIGIYSKDAKRSLIHIEKSKEASESKITQI